MNTEDVGNNRFMAAAHEYKSNNNGPNQEFRSFPKAEGNGDDDNEGGRNMNRGGGMRRNNSRLNRDDEDNSGNVRVWAGGMDNNDGPRGDRRFGGDRGDRDNDGPRGDRRFGGDRGDRNGPMRRPMGERPLPAGVITNQSRWQHNIVNLIKDPSQEKSETSTPVVPKTEEENVSEPNTPATPLTAVAQAQASFATSLGDDVAMATFRASVLRIVEDYMTSFAKDADKKNAASLATLIVGSTSKASYAVYVIASGIADSTSAGQRKQIAALVNAMRVSTKKQPAAANDTEIAAGLERAANSLPSNINHVEAAFYSFLEELTKAKNGFPAAALTGKALSIYNEKPQYPLATESLAAAMEEMGIDSNTSWGDAVLGTTSTTSSTTTTTTSTKAPATSSSSTTTEASESLTPISDVATQIINTGAVGVDLVTNARDATSKYSKVESTGALITALLKVSIDYLFMKKNYYIIQKICVYKN